jgi:hypothetical protein
VSRSPRQTRILSYRERESAEGLDANDAASLWLADHDPERGRDPHGDAGAIEPTRRTRVPTPPAKPAACRHRYALVPDHPDADVATVERCSRCGVEQIRLLPHPSQAPSE